MELVVNPEFEVRNANDKIDLNINIYNGTDTDDNTEQCSKIDWVLSH